MPAPCVVRALDDAPDPGEAFACMAGAPGLFFLDSGLRGGRMGRHSYLGADPFMKLIGSGRRVEVREGAQVSVHHGNPFEVLRRQLARFRVAEHPDIPFTSGAVGFLSYDLNVRLERLPRTTLDDIGFPEIYFAFHDAVAVWDHETGRAWLAATDAPGARGAPHERMDRLYRRMSGAPARAETARTAAIRSNFSRDEYLAAVGRAKDYIAAGDIFQVNLSQRFQTRMDGPHWALYSRLRGINPAPYAGFIQFGDKAVVSASPEMFLRVRGRSVETRPIKGTRPRGRGEAEDRRMRDELWASEKDKAELTMIVDLERNDLGRVCSYGSVRVAEPRVMEAFPTVWHGVATVEGELHDGCDRIDLLKAAFPGGSVTGAPKVRAMEIIDELEPTRRSVYTGAFGFLGFDGGMNLSIVIRTLLLNGNDAFFQVGGGIVADSDLAAEYDETLHKARALIEAVGGSVEGL